VPDMIVIEKVAKAMWEKNRIQCKGEVDLDPWEDEPEALRDDWRGFAVAAVDALADAVGDACDDFTHRPMYFHSMMYEFQEVIDTVLRENEERP